jgi:hypothetical protein
MATLVYGRSRRSPGGAVPKKHLRQHYATDPQKSEYRSPKPGFVGPPAPVERSRNASARPYRSTGVCLRLRRLPCGHGVLMMKGQFPDEGTFCTQCRDGKSVR